MKRKSSFYVLVLAAVPLMFGACDRQRPENSEYVIPPGVSVDPPRRAPQAGGLALPGTDPDTTQGGGTTSGAIQPDTLAADTPVLPNRP